MMLLVSDRDHVTNVARELYPLMSVREHHIPLIDLLFLDKYSFVNKF